MKKNIILIVVLIISYVFLISYADGYGTNVEYLGNATELYTVTVPAKMSPNSSGEVIVEGQWADNRIVNVSADESVELVNSINVFNKKTLDVNFNGVHANGSDISTQKLEETILVGSFDDNILFGEWKGIFNYNVEIIDDPYGEYYPGRTYTRTYLNENIDGNLPLHLITYEDKSIFFVYDDETTYHTKPNSLIIDSEYMYYGNMTLVMSEGNTKVTYIEPESMVELAIWELEQPNDILKNPFLEEINSNDFENNFFVSDDEHKLIRISNGNFSPLSFTKMKIVVDNNGVEYELYINELFNNSCIEKDAACYFEYSDINDEYKIDLYYFKSAISVGGIFVKHPGIYMNSSFNGDNVTYKFVENDIIYDLEWNTQDVKNNIKIEYDGYEYVKVFDDTKNLDYFENSLMNIIVDGNIINYYGSFSKSINDNFYMYDCGNNYQKVLVVYEPGVYDGVTFEEAGVYAFNFGKYGENYKINIGIKFSPSFENNIKYSSDYVYSSDIKYTFSDSGTGYMNDNISFEYNMFGRIIEADGSIGIVSKDGNKIKFYKHLSYSQLNDDIILEYKG